MRMCQILKNSISLSLAVCVGVCMHALVHKVCIQSVITKNSKPAF